MVAVAVGAVGHVLAGSARRPAMALVLLRGLFVTGAAALAADVEGLLQYTVGHRVLVQVAVQTVDAVVRRVGEVLCKDRSVETRLVTVGADRAVYRLEFIVLLGEDDAGAHAYEHDKEQGSQHPGRAPDRL